MNEPERTYNPEPCHICGYRGVACLCNDSTEVKKDDFQVSSEPYTLDDAMDNFTSTDQMLRIVLFRAMYYNEKLLIPTLEALIDQKYRLDGLDKEMDDAL